MAALIAALQALEICQNQPPGGAMRVAQSPLPSIKALEKVCCTASDWARVVGFMAYAAAAAARQARAIAGGCEIKPQDRDLPYHDHVRD